MCLFFCNPPTNVSSDSIVPDRRLNVPLDMAARMRCSMNHAVFCVTSMARPRSWDEMPFLGLVISQIAGSHLEKGSVESSKIVLTLIENWRLQPRHFQIFRVERKIGSI